MLTESHRCSLTVRHWDGKEEFGLICPEFMICALWVSSNFQNWLYILKLQRTPKKIVAKTRLQFIFLLSWFKQLWVEMVIPICQGSSLLVFFMFFARSQRAHCHIHLPFNGSQEGKLASNSVCKKNKIVASSLITSWQIEGEIMETKANYFLGLQITVNSDYIHEIKRYLFFGRKALTNLDSILKTETSLCSQRCVYSTLWFSSNHIKM